MGTGRGWRLDAIVVTAAAIFWAGCADCAGVIVVGPSETRKNTIRDEYWSATPGPPPTISQSFPLAGATTVHLRALLARCAQVLRTATGDVVTVSGNAAGGAAGYHGGPDWKETPASEVGLSFKSRRYGSKLVISTFNETAYIHDLYYVAELVIAVPPGVRVVLVQRTLDGDGDPDLGPEPTRREPGPLTNFSQRCPCP
jgi:hypothetical protein